MGLGKDTGTEEESRCFELLGRTVFVWDCSCGVLEFWLKCEPWKMQTHEKPGAARVQRKAKLLPLLNRVEISLVVSNPSTLYKRYL